MRSVLRASPNNGGREQSRSTQLRTVGGASGSPRKLRGLGRFNSYRIQFVDDARGGDQVPDGNRMQMVCDAICKLSFANKGEGAGRWGGGAGGGAGIC